MTVRQVGGKYATVVELLDAAARTNADIEAYVERADPGAAGLVPVRADGCRRISFARWQDAASDVAARFASLGVTKGDVVALWLPSSIDYAVCYLAGARLGAVTTGVNLRLGASEQAAIARRVRPALSVVDTNQIDADALAPEAGRIVPRSALSSAGTGGDPPDVTLGPEDPVAIVWTSGSTGVPKGAVFSHRSLEAVAAGTDVLSQVGDRRLSPLPFAHVGYMTRVWDEIAHGITTVITPTPWSAAEAISMMRSERVTVGQGVPTQWALALAHPDLGASRLPSLRIAATGAARVPPELVRAIRDRLGCTVVVRYTSTETSLGTGTDPTDPDDIVATTVGRPVPGVELAVVDDDGRWVPPGSVGGIRLRSAATMVGYVADRSTGRLVDEDMTGQVKDPSGWVTTGDLGWIGDDGRLRLVGRGAEMYIRGGYNVYPAEVESVLGDHPGVAHVAVVGVPDPVLGEIGVAYVVSRAGVAPPALDELRRTAARQLADYKAPDRLYLLEELPLTALGKVDKRALVARAADLEGTRETDPRGVEPPPTQATKVRVSR